MSIFLVNNAPEPDDNLLNEAFEYLKGCLEGSYAVDEDLLEACIDAVNENSDVVTVDDYNTVMESVDYLYEALDNSKLAAKRADRYWYKKHYNTGDKALNKLEKRAIKFEDKADKRGISDKAMDRFYDKYDKKELKLSDAPMRRLDKKAARRDVKIDRLERFGKVSPAKAEKLRDKLDDWYSKREEHLD